MRLKEFAIAPLIAGATRIAAGASRIATSAAGIATESAMLASMAGGNDQPTTSGKSPYQMGKDIAKATEEITVEDNQDFHEEFGELGYSIDESDMFEAEYRGRKVKLNKPMQGDVKKFKVYVKNKKGNVIKVNFGDPNMRIKKSNPKRRKSFRARHNCDNPGPKTKARYWSCRKW